MAGADAMQRYWLEHPPVHILVAGFVGYKPPKGTLRASQAARESVLEEFEAVFGRRPPG